MQQADKAAERQAVMEERRARRELLDAPELTTDLLEALEQAQEHRKSLGVPDRAVGEWEIEPPNRRIDREPGARGF
jgi:hypothetical protein